jgi:PAS domain S-box-containing protein
MKADVEAAMSLPSATVQPATEALLDAVPVALALFAADESLLVANRPARLLFGLASEPIAGHDAPTLQTIFSDDRATLEPLIRSARAGLTAPPTTTRLTGRHGEHIVELSVGALPDGSLLVSATDITARESLLAALERRARELAAIFEISSSSVRVLDVEGNIVRANSSALREHPGDRPRSLDELVAREQPLYPTTRQPLRDELHPGRRALRGEFVRGERYVVQRGTAGERRIMETHAAPIVDGARQILGAVLVMRDVTHQHRLASRLSEQVARTAELNDRVSTEAERLDRMVDERSRELLALQESRARDRRLSAIGQLAAGVMHDVNNALNPIMAAAWLLDHHADNPEAVRDYATRIAKAAETGAVSAARVGRFLRQEPIDAGERTVVDLSLVADEALQLTEPLVADRVGTANAISFRRELARGVHVQGVSGELREAALNLVQNAIDAMAEGGTLTLRTYTDGRLAYLEVIDTGIGMSEDVRDRAFEPFFSTKGAKGSGLGLSEVYGIVRRHRGLAEIESVAGQGTTIRVSAPLVEAPAHGQSATVPARALPSRILLVEDHTDGREFMRSVLCEVGHDVVAVGTFADARRTLMSSGASFDLLITDIGLPDGSGWELLHLARAEHPTMHVGVVTGWEPTVRGTGAGAADFILRKPLRAPDLLASLATILSSRDPEPRND